MLGHFPPSRPDECLYSIACEYKRRLGHPSHHHLAIRQDLFGFSGARDLVDIPTGLDHLIAHLPRGFNVDLDYLLWHTTALPYFAPFLTPTQLDAMIGHMRGAELNNRHYLLAPLRKASNRMPGFLRYCQFCAAADRDEWGATYWHRLHQLPSVHLCHKHEIELANSHIPRGMAISKALIHADDVVDDSIRPRHQVSSGRVQLLAWLSEQTEWLLLNPTTIPDRQRLQDVYRYYFYMSGFGSISGVLKRTDICKEMSRRYSRLGLDALLNIDFSDSAIEYWLGEVVRGNGTPLRHMMVVHFLGIDLQTLFRSLNRSLWFEAGPWPCLNPICRDYREPVIRDCKIQFRDKGCLTGTFTCFCGYSYLRNGPDTDGESRMLPSRAIRNRTWDQSLRELWTNTSFTIREIRDRLHATYVDMEVGLRRLHCDLHAKQARHWPPSTWPVPPTSQTAKDARHEQRRLQCRKQLRSWLNYHPGATRSQCYDGVDTGLRWLLKHDHEWVQQMLPKPLKRILPEPYLERREHPRRKRDKVIAVQLTKARRELLARPGPPKRITRNRLLGHIGYPNGFGKTAGLHRALKALDDNMDSAEEFAIRRLKWTCGISSEQADSFDSATY